VRCLGLLGILLVIALAGCGDGTETETVTVEVPASDAREATATTPTDTTTTGASDDPPVSVLREWPDRWCEVQIGDSREKVAQIMGAPPTKADSGVLAHIPLIHLNNRGENANEGPGPAATSDTWAVRIPDLVLFNAFYDASLHVQQLDFAGPDGFIPCPDTRVH